MQEVKTFGQDLGWLKDKQLCLEKQIPDGMVQSEDQTATSC